MLLSPENVTHLKMHLFYIGSANIAAPAFVIRFCALVWQWFQFDYCVDVWWIHGIHVANWRTTGLRGKENKVTADATHCLYVECIYVVTSKSRVVDGPALIVPKFSIGRRKVEWLHFQNLSIQNAGTIQNWSSSNFGDRFSMQKKCRPFTCRGLYVAHFTFIHIQHQNSFFWHILPFMRCCLTSISFFLFHFILCCRIELLFFRTHIDFHILLCLFLSPYSSSSSSSHIPRPPFMTAFSSLWFSHHLWWVSPHIIWFHCVHIRVVCFSTSFGLVNYEKYCT